MIPVFFDVRQSVTTNKSTSPSAQKPAEVVAHWQLMKHPITVMPFSPMTSEDLKLVHAPAYVDGILNCELPNGFGNTNAEVATSLPWVSGSMVAATLYALKNQANSFSPTSGAHHAHYNKAVGFCTFNFLVLAAVKAQLAGAKRIGIIDLDMHYGDGTDDIIRKLGLNFVQHYSFREHRPACPRDSLKWLERLPQYLGGFRDCDLILFNAGADPHINDPLGGLLTTEQMYKRDLIVYGIVKTLGIPSVTSLAGGYQRDASGGIGPVLELHNNTMVAFRKVFE
ncbi:MAG: histone deacetylase [Deltaproteobacteria bacterium]|jgi:acetoin utilization deacetylase AcuC-like enzyme|nr:histone deacetylase [Deltaproteobacteria bacterium]